MRKVRGFRAEAESYRKAQHDGKPQGGESPHLPHQHSPALEQQKMEQHDGERIAL
jgi:hypothetical protein